MSNQVVAGTHRHSCRSCGLVWEHPDATADLPETEFNAAHMCPRCRRGPYTIVLEPKTLPRHSVLYAGACREGTALFYGASRMLRLDEKFMESLTPRKVGLVIVWGGTILSSALGKSKGVEYVERCRAIPRELHNSDADGYCNLCSGCLEKVKIFVNLYNGEDRKNDFEKL